MAPPPYFVYICLSVIPFSIYFGLLHTGNVWPVQLRQTFAIVIAENHLSIGGNATVCRSCMHQTQIEWSSFVALVPLMQHRLIRAHPNLIKGYNSLKLTGSSSYWIWSTITYFSVGSQTLPRIPDFGGVHREVLWSCKLIRSILCSNLTLRTSISFFLAVLFFFDTLASTEANFVSSNGDNVLSKVF